MSKCCTEPKTCNTDHVAVGWAARKDGGDNHLFVSLSGNVAGRALKKIHKTLGVAVIQDGDQKKAFIAIKNGPGDAMEKIDQILCEHGQAVIEVDPMVPVQFIAAVAREGASYMLH